MSIIRGKLTRASQPVSGFRIVAYEEIRVGFKIPPRPCQIGSPSIKIVGETTTSSTGNFQVQFIPPEPFEGACSFRATVSIRIYDGPTLVWASPQKNIVGIINFDHDLLPIPPDNPDEPAIVRGTIYACGRPAAGFIVKAFEVKQIGIRTDWKPCEISETTTNLGSAITDTDGKFTIHFTPSPEIHNLCHFSVHIYIEVFDGTFRVWRSTNRPSTATINFVSEIYPDCSDNGTLIRVIDTTGERITNAAVYVNGRLKGKTNSIGQIAVENVTVGSGIAARYRVHENKTLRANHTLESDQNWNYRVYTTSIPVQYDENGDDVLLPLFVVSDPSVVQVIPISTNNAQIGLNLLVSLEWEATVADMQYYKDRLFETSELLYNATDGQFLIEHIVLADNSAYWNEADIRIYARRSDLTNHATVDGFSRTDGRVTLNSYGGFFPGTILHEFGHYLFGVWDEYQNEESCTLASVVGTNPLFADNGSKDSCMMRGAQGHCRKKICSAHHDNPHVKGTEQGDTDCWSYILDRFNNGFPNWRIHSPVARGVIVGRLPDSGITLSTTTVKPSSSDQAGSYIPVLEWKPRWHFDDTFMPNECQDLKVRVLHNGELVDDVKIYLNMADGRTLYQGRTGARAYTNVLSSGDGEIFIRGAHKDESITAYKEIEDNDWLLNTVTIPSAGPGLIIEINVERYSFDADFLRATPTRFNELTFSLKTNEPKSSRPPSVTLLIDDDSESHQITLDQYREEEAERHTAVNLQGSHKMEVIITAFDKNGEPHKFHSTISVQSILFPIELRMFSYDSQIEIILPSGAINSPAQVVIEQPLSFPGITKNRKILAGPYRVSSTEGDVLNSMGRLYFNLSDIRERNKRNRAVEILKYSRKKAAWLPMQSKMMEEPFCVAAILKRLGMYVLVEENLK